jgi:hypothetical protein
VIQANVAEGQNTYGDKKMTYGDTRPVHSEALHAAKDKPEQTLRNWADLKCLPVEVGRVLVSSGQLISPELT